MFNNDRSYIENKYHKTDKEFDPFRRMAYHGYAFDTSTGLEDDEILEGLKRLQETIKDLPHPVAKAYAVQFVLENTKIDINEHDWFVGLWSLNRLVNPTTQTVWRHAVFNEMIPEIRDKMADMNASGAIPIWPDFDHVVPDWDAIMKLGFAGLLERAKQYKARSLERNELTAEKEAFYDGIIIQYTAILELLDRLYRYALTKTHEKAPRIAQCLKHIRDGAPQNLYEAMQVIYLYFLLSECFDSYQVRSLGNGLDNTLWKYYNQDLQNGIYSAEEIREFFRYFLMQWSAIGNYWGQPLYLGGTNLDGSTKYNELSLLILDVYDELNIYNPKIQIKVNDNTPDAVLFKLLGMIRKGHNSFVFCCEPGMIHAVMTYGATYEEALNMDIRGCYETGIRANEVSTDSGFVNALKAVEYALYNGYDKTIGKQFGLQTGEAETLLTFEDFYHAVIRQWEYLIEMTISVASAYDPYFSYINPSNMYSATIENALSKGCDAYQCGVKFNNSAINNCAFADLVDSVMAVKEFVYEKKTVSLEELKSALDSNWSGYEELRTKIKKSEHKYGNNDAETDQYAQALSSYITTKINNRPNARGGVYKVNMHGAMEFVWAGEKTMASPNGRYDGEELSKNGSPCVGMDRNGVTALLNSVFATKPSSYCESYCIDIMLHPSAVSGDEGLRIMKSLLFSYMKHGGMCMQFNIFDANMLRDAQKHPEKYQNLQVRVSGWNVLWNNLSPKEQNAYIARAEAIK